MAGSGAGALGAILPSCGLRRRHSSPLCPQAFSNFYHTFRFLNLTSRQPLRTANATIWEFCQRPWKLVGRSPWARRPGGDSSRQAVMAEPASGQQAEAGGSSGKGGRAAPWPSCSQWRRAQGPRVTSFWLSRGVMGQGKGFGRTHCCWRPAQLGEQAHQGWAACGGPGTLTARGPGPRWKTAIRGRSAGCGTTVLLAYASSRCWRPWGSMRTTGPTSSFRSR